MMLAYPEPEQTELVTVSENAEPLVELHPVHVQMDSEFVVFVSINLKLSCDSRFQHAFTACNCVLKVITLVDSNQRNYFENAIACSKRMLKTAVATQLKQKKIQQRVS